MASLCRALSLTRKGDRMGILLRLSTAAKRGAFKTISARNISTRGYIGIDKDDGRQISLVRRRSSAGKDTQG